MLTKSYLNCLTVSLIILQPFGLFIFSNPSALNIIVNVQQVSFPNLGDQPMNMLGLIQVQHLYHLHIVLFG